MRFPGLKEEMKKETTEMRELKETATNPQGSREAKAEDYINWNRMAVKYNALATAQGMSKFLLVTFNKSFEPTNIAKDKEVFL